MSDIVKIVSIMGVLGIPSIFTMCVACIRVCMKYTKQIKILAQAQKAQMRAQLLKDYQTYIKRGYVYQLELDEWENQYIAYHALVGPNGILDNRRAELFTLPTK